MLSDPKAVVKAALDGRLVQWQTVVQAQSEDSIGTDDVAEAALADAPGVDFQVLEWSIVDSATSSHPGVLDFFVEISANGGKELVDILRSTGLVD